MIYDLYTHCVIYCSQICRNVESYIDWRRKKKSPKLFTILRVLTFKDSIYIVSHLLYTVYNKDYFS